MIVNFVSLFNDAITNGKITHSVAGGVFDIGFDGTHSYVRIVPIPEPSSLALVGLIGAETALPKVPSTIRAGEITVLRREEDGLWI